MSAPVSKAYETDTELQAVVTDETGKQVMLTVPKGSRIIILAEREASPNLTEVEWNGQTVMMFPADLRRPGSQ